ncbi:UNVERIFIED_CONTAM: hypothetical protein HDU68_007790 [Siphonaria sp. JEL0065]|nr:hypothetical protein HDU68_007790 [Siphonaria sp. JEL0065]
MVVIKPRTIFVSVASYRDSACTPTLSSIYSQARFPGNVYVGVCQQNTSVDPDCSNTYAGNFSQNIRTIRIPNTDAKGPTYARYLCASLYNNEQYFLQLDSHTLLVKDWDQKCMDMIDDLKHKGYTLPMLSYYPRTLDDIKTYKALDIQQARTVPRICQSFFNDRGMISFKASEFQNTQGQMYETPFIAAGFFFCEAGFLNTVPFDPTLDFIFVGEEILHSVRFWTSGYNIFTPRENIAFHQYTRANEPKIWTDNPGYSDLIAFKKIKQILGIAVNPKTEGPVPPPLDPQYLSRYGVGKTRSLAAYYKFAGIDPTGCGRFL